MSIVLRTNKGSALTYDEMDRNQSQFFYSSSKSPDGLKLRLHYTGSDNLDTTEDYGPTRYHEVSFPLFESEIPDSNVAGDNTQIQFNDNGNFGADSVFVFTDNNHSVGIGTTTPLKRLDIVGDGARGGNIALRGSVNHEGEIQSLAGIEFYNGNTDATLLGKVGRLEYIDSDFADDIFIHSGDHNISSGFVPEPNDPRSVHISLGRTTLSTTPANRIGATFKRIGSSPYITVGINNTDSILNLSVVGNNGIGISHTNTATNDHSRLKSIKSNNSYFLQETALGLRKLLPHQSIAEGLEISSPNTSNGGNVLMVINTDSEAKERFNIITTQNSSAPNATVLATFQASGKVGIGTNFPAHTGLTIQEQLSIKSLTESDPLTEISRTLVADSTGLVKEVVAAPVPKGGIIMWSGATNAIPEGWRLCKNGVGEVNGVTVPNLSNKFIIASSNSTGTPTTTILGTGATSTGGSNTHNHGGNTQNTTLTLSQIPAHDHIPDTMQGRFRHLTAWVHPSLDGATGGSGTNTNTIYGNLVDGVGNTGTSFDDNAGGEGAEIISQIAFPGPPNGISSISNMAIKSEGGNAAHKHVIDAASNIPQFYALAYIIYVGV